MLCKITICCLNILRQAAAPAEPCCYPHMLSCCCPQVQLDIRTGHAQTVEKVLGWLDEEGGVAGTSVGDCGCGTGSLAVPLALRVRDCFQVHSERSHKADSYVRRTQPACIDSAGTLQQMAL